MRRTLIWTVLAALALTGASTPVSASDRSVVRVELQSTGVDPDATGALILTLQPDRSRLRVKLQGLDPLLGYEFRTDGVTRASFQPRSNGTAALRLRGPDAGNDPLLDFDPRGVLVTIHDGTSDVLQADLMPGSEPAGSRVLERSTLASTPAAPNAAATAQFRLIRDGRTKFDVKIEDTPPGDYTLFVDGIPRASITIGATGRGKVKFDSQPGARKLLLDFDPRSGLVDVALVTDVVLTGPVAAGSQGVNVCDPTESEVFLIPTGLGGKAKARNRTRDDCDRDFRVEVEEVPEGTYELLVGGISRGTLEVVFDASSGENEGQIEFDTDPDDPGELLLDFDPVGQVIEVVQGATLFFSSILDPSDPGSQTCTEMETVTPLLDAGPAPAASGEARFRTRDDCDEDYRVKIEDLPAGDYDLVVGGVVRGVIPVAFDPIQGQNEGQIEFDTDPDEPGEILLTFDPTGLDVEIVQASVVFLSATGVPGGGGPTSCSEDEIEVPLLNTGVVAAANGDVRHRIRDDCRESLRVEIEDLADGSYALRVAGVPQSDITVTLGMGEIQFDTDDPPKPLLDFPVRG
ncbi:MAG: hypothetical protein JRH10_17390 [Deltaproteobacteria bacterium]|nr:hypothetical protein [Deltaproteobacteria bacterium]